MTALPGTRQFIEDQEASFRRAVGIIRQDILARRPDFNRFPLETQQGLIDSELRRRSGITSEQFRLRQIERQTALEGGAVGAFSQAFASGVGRATVAAGERLGLPGYGGMSRTLRDLGDYAAEVSPVSATVGGLAGGIADPAMVAATVLAAPAAGAVLGARGLQAGRALVTGVSAGARAARVGAAAAGGALQGAAEEALVAPLDIREGETVGGRVLTGAATGAAFGGVLQGAGEAIGAASRAVGRRLDPRYERIQTRLAAREADAKAKLVAELDAEVAEKARRERVRQAYETGPSLVGEERVEATRGATEAVRLMSRAQDAGLRARSVADVAEAKRPKQATEDPRAVVPEAPDAVPATGDPRLLRETKPGPRPAEQGEPSASLVFDRGVVRRVDSLPPNEAADVAVEATEAVREAATKGIQPPQKLLSAYEAATRRIMNDPQAETLYLQKTVPADAPTMNPALNAVARTASEESGRVMPPPADIQRARIEQRRSGGFVQLPQLSEEAKRDLYLKAGNAASDIATIAGDAGNAIDNFMADLSYRVRGISPELDAMMMKNEFDIKAQGQAWVKPFVEYADLAKKYKLHKNGEIARELMNSGRDAATRLAVSSGATAADARKIVGLLQASFDTLDEIGDQMVEVGMITPDRLLKGYWPRKASGEKGRAGILRNRNLEPLEGFQRLIADKARERGYPLTEDEVGDAFVEAVNRRNIDKAKPGALANLKHRAIENVTQEDLPFYENYIDTAISYVLRMSNEIGKRRLLGTGEVTEDSIKSFVGKNVVGGNLPIDRVDELRNLVKARMVGDLLSPNKYFGGYTNLTSVALIGNPKSAAIQLTGVFHAMYNEMKQGLLPWRSVRAAVMQPIKYEDLGIQDFAETMIDGPKFSKLTRAFLKGSGFSWIERVFDGQTFINASYATNQALARRNKAAFAEKWRPYFGDQTESVMEKVASGVRDRDTLLLPFVDTSRVRPITPMQRSEFYLNHPNLRWVAMLASFTRLQQTLVREDVIRQWNRGNHATALKNAAKYTLMVGGGTMAVDEARQMAFAWLAGEETPEHLDRHAFERLFDVTVSNFNFRYYDYVHARGGGTIRRGLGTFIPPTQPWDTYVAELGDLSLNMAAWVANEAAGTDLDTERPIDAKSMAKRFPVAGPLLPGLYEMVSGEPLPDNKRDRGGRRRRDDGPIF